MQTLKLLISVVHNKDLDKIKLEGSLTSYGTDSAQNRHIHHTELHRFKKNRAEIGTEMHRISTEQLDLIL